MDNTEKEMTENVISVRRQGEGDLGTMDINNFVNLIKSEIEKSVNN